MADNRKHKVTPSSGYLLSSNVKSEGKLLCLKATLALLTVQPSSFIPVLYFYSKNKSIFSSAAADNNSNGRFVTINHTEPLKLQFAKM